MKIKFLNIKNMTAAVLVTAAVTGCTKFKDFGDTNVNPNATTYPLVNALLTNVEAGLAGNLASDTRGGLYCQYFSETQYTDVSQYSLAQVNMAGFYSGPLYDLQNIIQQNPGNNMTAVARILKAYIFWNLTDRWGDIPYSQALKGVVPGYDKQQDIYQGIISELKAAVAQFDGASVITGDVIYNNNVSSWKKFANSIRMLAALRLSKKYPNAGQYAATEFKAAMEDGGGHITANADNMVVAYPGGNFKNPWYNTYDGRKDYAQSKTYSDLLAGLSDARAPFMGGDAASASSVQGFPYGLNRADALVFESANSNTWARILLGSLRAENAKLTVVNAAQVALAKAEAIERGWVTIAGTTSEDLYKAGIDMSYAQWGAGSATSYYAAATGANFNTGNGVAAIGQNSFGSIPASSNAVTATKLDRIALQRYIATYPDGAQGWFEWRRTGVPGIKPTTFAVSPSKLIPRRLVYGTSEYSLNPGGVAQGASSMPGGDTQDSKMWLDQ